MSLLIAIKFIFFIAGIYFSGWQFLRRILKQDELYFLIPASLAVGIINYVFLLNLFGYLLPVKIAIWLVWLLLLLSAFFLYKIKAEPVIVGLKKNIFYWLIFSSAVSLIFFGSIIIARVSYDQFWHSSLISTIANGNFPVMSPFIPDNPVQYHYGFDLFAAALSYFTGIGTILASDLAMIILVIFIFWLAFAAIYKITNSVKAGMLSAWLLFFGGGFRYLTVLTDLNFSPANFFSWLNQIFSLFKKVAPLSPGYFHGYSVDSLGPLIYQRPTLMAIPVILILLWLIYEEYKTDKIIFRILTGAYLGFLALSYETAFAIILFSWFLWKMYLVISENSFNKSIFVIESDQRERGNLVVAFFTRLLRRFTSRNDIPKLKNIFLVCVIAATIALIQGGVITDTVFKPIIFKSTAADTSVSSFKFNLMPGLSSFSGFYPLNKVYSYLFLIVEWGLPLILLPFAYYYVLKKKDNFLKLFLIIISVSLLIAFFVSYPALPHDMTKVNTFAFFIICLLLGICLTEWSKNKIFSKALVAIIPLIAVSPLMYNILAFPSALKIKKPPFDQAVINFAGQVKGIITERAIVVTASPEEVSELWGALADYGLEKGKDVYARKEPGDILPEYLKNNSPEAIKQKGREYLYYNPLFAGLIGQSYINKNMDSLEEIANFENKYILYKIK